jgi:adenylate cyclase
MNTEIEHRFLVRSDGWRKLVDQGADLRQGYLSTDSKRNVRVRIASDGAHICIKGKAKGLTRPEFEYPIPVRDGEKIEKLCRKPILEKVRYSLKMSGLTWTIDEYAGENRGLVIAEVETKDRPEKLPPWVGPEVSTDERYRNYYLVEHPFGTWGQDKPKPKPNYSFASGETVAMALPRILKEQIETAVTELSQAIEPDDVAIHEARKSVKRARSALRLIRPAIEDRFDEENGRLQQIGRKLSELRDAQALIETLTELEQKEAEHSRTKAEAKREFKNAFDRLNRRKNGLMKNPRAKAEIRDAAHALEASLQHLGNLPFAVIDFAVLIESFETTLARGRKACAEAYSRPVAANFHELRKRVKDLHYQLTVLAPLWPEVLSGYSKSAKELEQYLGDDHNLAVLADVLNRENGRDGPFKLIAGFAEKKQAKLRHKAKLVADRLYAEPPKVWRKRLNLNWQSWQSENQSDT